MTGVRRTKSRQVNQRLLWVESTLRHVQTSEYGFTLHTLLPHDVACETLRRLLTCPLHLHCRSYRHRNRHDVRAHVHVGHAYVVRARAHVAHARVRDGLRARAGIAHQDQAGVVLAQVHVSLSLVDVPVAFVLLQIYNKYKDVSTRQGTMATKRPFQINIVHNIHKNTSKRQGTMATKRSIQINIVTLSSYRLIRLC